MLQEYYWSDADYMSKMGIDSSREYSEVLLRFLLIL
jgi:hypothetical protein